MLVSSTMTKIRGPQELEALRESILQKRNPDKTRICICAGTGCSASESRGVIAAFREQIAKHNMEDKIDIQTTGCHGFCERGPLVVVQPQGIMYEKVRPQDAAEAFSETVLNGRAVDRLLYVDPLTNQKVALERDVPFYRKQTRVLLRGNGSIDPTRIDDYVAIGGYAALAKVISGMSPGEVTESVKLSGLRGRGGAGFPTGTKWESCRKSGSRTKYVVCNGDEGDPGAYMDRSILEGNPHSVIEGMIIGAYAIGAASGFIYVRTEYPLAVKHARMAVDAARAYGFLGSNILGSDLNFDLDVFEGAGAFVCGEETALIASIEGRRGTPAQRPPYPTESGLWGKPTNINNVKTWASVPVIVNRGHEWYSAIGTKGSKGTTIFSLVGKVKNTGLIEVPMGITLRQIVFDIGGGIPNGRRAKAVQIGGPSGGCIPERLFDLPVDYESLSSAGATMGSGGIIVVDDSTCMVDLAKYFTNFLQCESCGKCLSCREGLKRIYEILTGVVEGKGREGDIELLEELAPVVKEASLCGLGQTAANPVLSTLRYFRDEYEAHIFEKKCPAKVCRALIKYSVTPDLCTGCGACAKVCQQEAIHGEPKKQFVIDQEKCVKCGVCMETCTYHAIEVE